ncbi:hypothetical protein QFC20_001463 [Naganishia adeliensis]|uniref:Uncharacterized protein n=1 Tax=Naganishia adeliensis TaxID=92952 RepID=A0ACC2WTT9_9TREE|nr:hypothetical protein QFC20_001463 [Naganishia adeliensis]
MHINPAYLTARNPQVLAPGDTSAGNASSSSTGTASDQFATSQKPFNAAFLALLALLIFIVLGGILYARRLARANESPGVSSGVSSSRGRGDDHEKVPLTRVPSLQYEEDAGVGPTEQSQPANLWNKAASITRARTPSLAGIGTRRFRGQDSSPDRDVERNAALTAEPTTPTKASTTTRLFTGVKEPKSPKADKFSSRVSGEASSVEGGRRRYGDLAGSVSAETLDHLMSIASAKVPGQAQKGPPPLRKRYVNKAAVGTPIVTTPIIPGEMARLVTPGLIPVEEARVRAAGSSSGLPLLEHVLDDVGSEEYRRRPGKEPLPIIEEASGREESDDGRSVSPTSQADRMSRPTSVTKRATPSEGRRDSEDIRQQGNPFPWDPTPPRTPRINTPLINELRRSLLSGRPSLLGSTSQEQVSRELDVAVPGSALPQRHKMRRRSLTEPDDDRKAQAEMRQTDLSPWNMKTFPSPSQQSMSTEGGLVPRYSSGSSWDASSGSSGRYPPMGSFASRSSGFLWSGSNIDASQGNHPQSQADVALTGGTHDQSGIREVDENQDEDEEQDEVATIEHKQFSPRRMSVAPPRPGQAQPRSSVWSMASEYSSRGSPEKETKPAVGPKHLTMEPVAPLRLSPDRGRRLPTPPPVQLRRGSAQSQQGKSTTATDASQSRTTDVRESPPSPTSVHQEQRRFSSISHEVMRYFDPRVAEPGPNQTIPSDAVPPIKIDFVTTSDTPAKSPAVPTPPSAEPLSTSTRTSMPRKPISPLLEDLQTSRNLFRGRKTATPPAHSPLAKPRLRFSDDVEVMENPALSPSPAPTTSRVLTPATRQSLPGSRARTPTDIVSPQPVPRRGSIVVPSPSAMFSNIESSDNASSLPSVQLTESTSEEWQPRAVDPPRPSIESIPEAWQPRDLDAPKAVQTRDFWRELRRTSVTGYFVQAAQDEEDSGNNDAEGEDSLR